MDAKTQKPKDIDEYIKGWPVDIRNLLEQMRETIRQAAPMAQEKISYGIPTYYLHENLVHFAAFKNHIGFYPSSGAINFFRDELSAYDGAKGTVQFKYGKPLPLGLVRKIVKYRVKQVMEKAKI